MHKRGPGRIGVVGCRQRSKEWVSGCVLTFMHPDTPCQLLHRPWHQLMVSSAGSLARSTASHAVQGGAARGWARHRPDHAQSRRPETTRVLGVQDYGSGFQAGRSQATKLCRALERGSGWLGKAEAASWKAPCEASCIWVIMPAGYCCLSMASIAWTQAPTLERGRVAV